jgi:hypothetical protein
MRSDNDLPMRSKNCSNLLVVRSLPTHSSCAALLELVDQGQILVPFGILDLVDADGPDRPQIAICQPPID